MSKEKRTLTAKKYLSQLEMIDTNINQNLERLDAMKTSAIGTGGIDYSLERVQASVVGDKLCSDVSRYIAFNEKINAEIDRFIGAEEKIIKEIRGLHDNNYSQVLFKVYVQFKSIRQTAKEMKRSYNYTLEIHKKALTAFEETYKSLYYLC